ncbi:cytochrome b [Cognatiluteimonas weifangensis]|uniref:Cytochrome b n=1 Tax=Cognatiluteimonas weifangensis TaxID=2303539 RepID=A0A372DSD4_9GAMM|nr:cytochrome b [Luteimonas weifangensis]RFP62488.1 cytochrome b [Luteimonas weifangensis]
MILKNSATRWGAVSQALHWLIVALILVMAYLGLSMTELPNTPVKVRVYALHKSIGLGILALVVLRLAWRGYAGAPRALPGPRWQQRAAALAHAALYGLLLAMPLSGWLAHSASGFPLRWFGLLRVPPLVARNPALQDLAERWHAALFWTLAALVLVHAAAAFWHHLFRRDATLARMLPRGWLRVPASEESSDA